MPAKTDTPAPQVTPSFARELYRLRRESYRDRKLSTGASDHSSDFAKKLEESKQEQDRLKDAFLRARADMENYRRRVERDQEEASNRRAREVILAMLPVLDNFERAIQASASATDAASVVSGVEMIRDQFKNALTGLGVSPVNALGEKFDPRFHEAIGVEESEEADDGSVIDVLQHGFTMGDKLLRPSMVRVAKKKT